ncbi:hypothetical protein BaRGS_00030935 [Batillaria attramentaria]|uniref:Uncharacterized protein n=1 Tax=Batillaria attramentaria TaxID=370345 RepID=A0ABD0JTE4_9CAEN
MCELYGVEVGVGGFGSLWRRPGQKVGQESFREHLNREPQPCQSSCGCGKIAEVIPSVIFLLGLNDATVPIVRKDPVGFVIEMHSLSSWGRQFSRIDHRIDSRDSLPRLSAAIPPAWESRQPSTATCT